MFGGLKTILRKNTTVYSYAIKFYDNVVRPVKSGHLKYYLSYSINHRNEEINELKKYGFTKIKPINWQEWRIGKGKDGAHRRYYEAFSGKQKCFVKVGFSDATVDNELLILENESITLPFSPRLIAGSRTFSENTAMVAVEFIEGLSKFRLPENLSQFEHICVEFQRVLELLKQCRIVHADIHKGNLMMKGNELFLLDYGISMNIDLGNNIDYMARPGTYYRIENDMRKYDDAFSFVKTIENYNPPEEYKNSPMFLEIKEKVDDFYFLVKL